jgi:hypothetical protein
MSPCTPKRGPAPTNVLLWTVLNVPVVPVVPVVRVVTKSPLAVSFAQRSATRTPRIHMALELPSPKSRPIREINQPMIVADVLVARRFSSKSVAARSYAPMPIILASRSTG